VPFCLTRCSYCAFAITTRHRSRIPEYLDAIVAEIRAGARVDADRRVPLETAYLGGGTPSLLPASGVRRILDVLRSERGGLGSNREVTIEANPETFDSADVEAWLQAGVTRLSLGVQSLDDSTLRRLGRTHDAAGAARAVSIARAAGVGSLSLDLIYGLPGQCLGAWIDHLRRVLDFAPDHLSLYALAIEAGTALSRQIARKQSTEQAVVPDDDLVADMYEAALPILADAGLEHDEVSNWARPGHASRHNRVYWRNEAYVGVGPAAHRYAFGRRSWNVPSLPAYLAHARANSSPELGNETLSADATASETAMLALRIRHEGIDFARFKERFGFDPRDRWPRTIAEAAAHGLLQVTDQRACLTDPGLLVSNEVGRRLLAEVAQ
jgi:oxygen-independent coproporphyrinogen-3 oxidase